LQVGEREGWLEEETTGSGGGEDREGLLRSGRKERGEKKEGLKGRRGRRER